MKLCVDCKHCNFDNEFSRCERTIGIDPVTGGKGRHKLEFCRTHRSEGFPGDWFFGMCGKRGRFWEPK